MANNTFITIKRSELMKSMKTDGQYFTLIARNLDNNKSYKVWADTTFDSFNAWNNLSEGDMFTNVEIINEPRRLLSVVNTPRKVKRTINNIQTNIVFI